jgi:hypothetical protein
VRVEGVVSWAIWITGRPGSGKTTLAVRVAEAVQAWPVTLTVLDLAGARLALVGRGWAAPAEEETVHRTLAYTAKLLTDAGVAVAPGIALDYEESLHPELRLHTHAPDFRSTVEDVLLLARRLHRAAAATVTPAGRNVP